VARDRILRAYRRRNQGRATADIKEAVNDRSWPGRRKNIIHGLIEIDVTEARRRLRQADAAGRGCGVSARSQLRAA
jgi:hypothetical protein